MIKHVFLALIAILTCSVAFCQTLRVSQVFNDDSVRLINHRSVVVNSKILDGQLIIQSSELIKLSKGFQAGGNGFFSAKYVNTLDQIEEERFQLKGVDIYPNPASQDFTVSVQMHDQGIAKLEIFDMNGRRVFEQDYQLPKGKSEIPLNGEKLSKGIYALVIQRNGTIESEHLIVE